MTATERIPPTGSQTAPGRTPPLRIAAAALALAGMLAPAGCSRRKEQARRVSSARYLLDLQHKVWRNARQTLHSDRPNINKVAVVYSLLADRTRRRVEADYTGPDKAELLDRLDRLAKAYRDKVIAQLDMTGAVPALRAGVSADDVRKAFMEIDPDYRRLEAMSAPPP